MAVLSKRLLKSMNFGVLRLVALMLGIYHSSSLPALRLVLVLFRTNPRLTASSLFLQSLPSSLIVSAAVAQDVDKSLKPKYKAKDFHKISSENKTGTKKSMKGKKK
jgi:hypothetical protein